MKTVIEMARESGLLAGYEGEPKFLEDFAELVRADERKQIALDKKAENARELGLDYDPAQDSGVVTAGGFDPRTQRTWVGLTNNELQPIADEYRILFGSWVEEFARAIEEKLKEKNT